MVLQRGRDCFCCVSVLQQREPHLPIMDDTVVQLRWSELKDGLMKCVICRDIFTQTRTTKEVGCAAPLSRPRRRGARDPVLTTPSHLRHNVGRHRAVLQACGPTPTPSRAFAGVFEASLRALVGPRKPQAARAMLMPSAR